MYANTYIDQKCIHRLLPLFDQLVVVGFDCFRSLPPGIRLLFLSKILHEFCFDPLESVVCMSVRLGGGVTPAAIGDTLGSGNSQSWLLARPGSFDDS